MCIYIYIFRYVCIYIYNSVMYSPEPWSRYPEAAWPGEFRSFRTP